MKVLTLVVHTDVQHDLSELLRSMEQVSGFTFTHVEGHGAETEKDPYLSAKDKVVGFVPRIRCEILLGDSEVDEVLSRLRDKQNNITGQGVYWVTPAEMGGHLL